MANKDNSGALFKNDRKETDNHPDYNGQALIGGVDYWMSAWMKEAESGRKYMSFSFKPKEAKPESKPAAKPTHGEMKKRAANFDDEPPF